MKNLTKKLMQATCLIAVLAATGCQKEADQPTPVSQPTTTAPVKTYSCNSESDCLALSDAGLFQVATSGGAGNCKAGYRGGTSTLMSVSLDGVPLNEPVYNTFLPTDAYDQGAVMYVSDIAPTLRRAIKAGNCFLPSSGAYYTYAQLYTAALSHSKNYNLGMCQVGFRGGTSDLVSITVAKPGVATVILKVDRNNRVLLTDAYDQEAVKSISKISQDLAIVYDAGYCN